MAITTDKILKSPLMHKHKPADVPLLVPYTGATADVDLGAKNFLTTGALGAGAITGTSFIIGANTLDTIEWAYLDGQDQAVKVASSPQFAKVKTPIIYPASDSTTAVQIRRADGTTNVLNVDTTNSRVGIGTTSPLSKLSINGGLHVGGDSDAGDNNLLVDGTLEAGAITGTSFIVGADTTPTVINGVTLQTAFTYQIIGDILNGLTACKLLLGWFSPSDAGTEVDLSGVTGHTVTYTDSSDWTASDRITKGLVWTLDFDGSNDYLTISDNDDFSFGDSSTDSNFTIGGWVQIVDSAVTQDIIYKWDATAGSELREWAFAITTDEKLRFFACDESANKIPYRTTDAALSVGWHFVQVVYDSAGGTGATFANGITIYVDGLAVASTATNNASYVAMENLSVAPTIGAGKGVNGTPTQWFKGDMGQIFITKEALTAATIWKMYIKTRGFYNL